MKKLLLIKDMKGWFWRTYPTMNQAAPLDLSLITDTFTNQGFTVEITSYSDFDFSRNYSGYYVLYGSSEDFMGGSKSFMEDVLLWLDSNEAILLPAFKFFRAHDNKVMMELLRHNFKDDRLKTIHSDFYASPKALKTHREFPLVIKAAAGAGSNGVFLARNEEELARYVDRASRLLTGFPFLYYQFYNRVQFFRRKAPVYFNNNKFILQNFIPNLNGDFKILVFGESYFVLYRLNREGDFRASGSGKFGEIPEGQLNGVLDFARLCKQELEAPHISLDIGFDGQTFHLLEFQCVTFGFKAMSLAEFHFRPVGSKWQRIEGKVIPEEEFCRAVIEFLQRNNK